MGEINSSKELMTAYADGMTNAVGEFTNPSVGIDNFTDLSGYRNMCTAYGNAVSIFSSINEGINRDAANIISVAEIIEETDNNEIVVEG